MANPHRGEVAVPGTDIVLRYDINGFCEIEEAMGINLAVLMLAIAGDVQASFRQMRALLWGGMRGGSRPKATMEEAGHVLSEVGPRVLMPLIYDAMTGDGGPTLCQADAPEKRHAISPRRR